MSINRYFEKIDINSIHNATITILSKKGIRIPNRNALRILSENGIKVEDDIVYISEENLRDALIKVPSQFEIKARNPEKNVVIGGGKTCFCSSGGSGFIKNMDEYKPSESDDLIKLIKLVETSPVLDMFSTWITTANDIPSEQQTLFQLAVSLKYSTKPIIGVTAGYELSKKSIHILRDFYDMYGEDDYLCMGIISPISPLSYDDSMIESIIAYAEEKQPLLITSAVLLAATGPITQAGAIAMANAEILAGLVLAQCIRPGTPVVIGNASGGTDLRYVTPAIGSPEAAITALCLRELSDLYGVPCRSGGALTDSKCNDAQSAIESTMVMMTSVLAGIDFIFHSAGVLDSYNMVSYDKFLADEEMIKMCLKIKSGLSVNENTLALDAVMKVPHGGEYLSEPHTVKNLRKSLYMPEYFEKGYLSSWKANGERKVTEVLYEGVKKRLSDYKQTELTNKQLSAIKDYLMGR